MRTLAQGRLTFGGGAVASERLPVDVFARAVDSLQRIVHLIAAGKEGAAVAQRFKPSAELRRRHSLLIGHTEPGSYVVPLVEADMRTNPEMYDDSALEVFHEFIYAVSTGDDARAREVIPDQAFRKRVVDSVGDMIPAPGADLTIGFSVGEAAALALDDHFQAGAGRLVESVDHEVRRDAVIGEFRRINLDHQRFELYDPLTQRMVACTYRDADRIEHEIWPARRDLVRVVGDVTRDQADIVIEVSVISAEAVCREPFTISEFSVDGRRFTVTPPMHVVPSLESDAAPYLSFDDDDFHVHVIGDDSDELRQEIIDNLVFAYDTYANAADDDLAPEAQRLKETLLGRIRVRGDHAAQAS